MTTHEYVRCDDELVPCETSLMLSAISKVVNKSARKKSRSDKRKKAEGYLTAWGEYFTNNGISISSGINPSDLDDFVFDGEGYDTGITDRLSLIISVETFVMSLNPIDRDLAVTLYQAMTEEAKDIWMLHYEATRNAMLIRKHRLIDKVYENIKY